MRLLVVLLAFLAAVPARAGDFDYYLLALSWSPAWCAEGDREGEAEQCERDLGFILHGLWPQYEDGWPEFCATGQRDPTRRQTAAMADIMGSGGLAWYQWQKHGRCTGLSAEDYFATARFAYGLTTLPDLPPRATAPQIEAAVVAANPGLAPEDLIVTCREGVLREVRICLTSDLSPRPCGADVERGACRIRGALDAPPPR
jgi:ribonuclease T2